MPMTGRAGLILDVPGRPARSGKRRVRLPERAGAEALADMRRLLGVLRSDQPAALAPQAGLPTCPS
jgi:hypothetical protein